MATTADIARGVARAIGTPKLPETLANLGGARLKSLLMYVAQLRSKRRSPADLARQAQRDATVEPCSVDLRQLLEIDRLAMTAFRDFDAVDLSMLQPAGTSSVLGAIDQNSVLATIANTEVVADPTSALALEAAARRSSSAGSEIVRLCTSQRVLRMQRFDSPSFTRHFRLFAAVTAGRDRGAETFEMSALREQLAMYLAMMASLAAAGYQTAVVSIEVTDLRLTRKLAAIAGFDLDALLRSTVRAHSHASYRQRFVDGGVDLPESFSDPAAIGELAGRCGLEPERARLSRIRDEVFAPLSVDHPSAAFGFAPFRLEGGAYYRDYCFRLFCDHPELGRIAPGDGGFTTWTARLRGNRKERLLTSGLGTEVLARLFSPG